MANLPDDQQFKNFHRTLCERFGYSHDEQDWQRDQISLIEHIAARMMPTRSLEDWLGSDLESAARFEVFRAFNGVVVRAGHDYSRDTVAVSGQTLVFQNPEHLWSWVQHWLNQTSVAK